MSKKSEIVQIQKALPEFQKRLIFDMVKHYIELSERPFKEVLWFTGEFTAINFVLERSAVPNSNSACEWLEIMDLINLGHPNLVIHKLSQTQVECFFIPTSTRVFKDYKDALLTALNRFKERYGDKTFLEYGLDINLKKLEILNQKPSLKELRDENN